MKAKKQRRKNHKNTGNITGKRSLGRIENLRPPFPKGVSGNPAGRPKDPLTAALKTRCDEKMADAIAKMMLQKARRGSVRHFREVADRIEGRVKYRLELESQVGATVSFNVQHARAKLFEKLSAPDKKPGSSTEE
jgi:hypothetical protein